MKQNENICDINDLLDECYIVYEYNIEALVLHVYTLMAKANRKKTKSSILNDFSNKINLDKYRVIFEQILDCFQEELNIYITLTKLNIKGSSGLYIYLKDNISNIQALQTKQKNEIKQELIETLYNIEQVLSQI